MKKRLLCLLILMVGIFIITGCNNSKKENIKKTKADINNVQKKKKVSKKEEKKDTIVGNYEIIKLKDDNDVYDKKTISSLNLDYSFEVRKDRTATMRFIDQEENLTYDDRYFINEKEKIEYKYKKGKLVLSKDDTILTFKKK